MAETPMSAVNPAMTQPGQRRMSSRRRLKFGETAASGGVENLDLVLRNDLENGASAPNNNRRVVNINSVALTNTEIYTWLQTHELEVDKMRDLFCRKKPSEPAAVAYADATFSQIASFKSIHVRDMPTEARKAGIRASRKLSAGEKKKSGEGGAGQVRDNIDKLLAMAFMSKPTNPRDEEDTKNQKLENTEHDHIDESDEKTAASGVSEAGSEQESKSDMSESKDMSVTDEALDPAKTTAAAPASVPAPAPAPAPAPTQDTGGKKAAGGRWSLWGGTPAKKDESLASDQTPVQLGTALEEPQTIDTQDSGSTNDNAISVESEADWSSDDESWDDIKKRLDIDELRDHFYVYSNDSAHATGAVETRKRAQGDTHLSAAPLPVALQQEILSTARAMGTISGTGDTMRNAAASTEPKVIVNCLDVSLNRFRFLDFASASSTVNWSVSHIVALNLSGNLLVSLEGIEACAQLRVLICNDNLLTSMTPLRRCKQLRRLKISGNRLNSLSFLSDSQLADYYKSIAKGDKDIDIDGFDDDEELESDKITGLDDVMPSSSSLNGDDSSEINASSEESTGPKAPHKHHHTKNHKYPNTLVLPELEYMDASDNKLDLVHGLEGLRLYSRNSLVHLELRNCGIMSHHLNHLRMLPLVRLHLDDNGVDNLKHTVAVLKSIKTVEHLSFLGNPIARNIDKGRETCENGVAGNNHGSNLKLDQVLKLKTAAVKARHLMFGKMTIHSSEDSDRNVPPSNMGTLKELANNSGGGSGNVGEDQLSIVEKLLKGTDLLEEIRANRAKQEGDGMSPDKGDASEEERKNYYAITVLDHVDSLKTFDHLAVPPFMYLELRRLKASVEGDILLRDIERHYGAEIDGIEHIHANLAAMHRQKENVVQQVVKEKAGRLESEMDTLMKFAREKMAEIRSDRRTVFKSRAAASSSNEDDEETESKTMDADHINPEEAEVASMYEEEKQLPAKNIRKIRDEYARVQANREAEKQKQHLQELERERTMEEALQEQKKKHVEK